MSLRGCVFLVSLNECISCGFSGYINCVFIWVYFLFCILMYSFCLYNYGCMFVFLNRCSVSWCGCTVFFVFLGVPFLERILLVPFRERIPYGSVWVNSFCLNLVYLVPLNASFFVRYIPCVVDWCISYVFMCLCNNTILYNRVTIYSLR